MIKRIKTFDDVLKEDFNEEFIFNSNTDKFNFFIEKLFNHLYDNGFKMTDTNFLEDGISHFNFGKKDMGVFVQLSKCKWEGDRDILYIKCTEIK